MRIPSTEFLLRPRVYETPTFWQVASHSGDRVPEEQPLAVVGLPLLRRRRRRRQGEQQLEPLRRRRGEEGRCVSGGAEGMRPRQRGRGMANYERSFGKIYTVKSARIH